MLTLFVTVILSAGGWEGAMSGHAGEAAAKPAATATQHDGWGRAMARPRVGNRVPHVVLAQFPSAGYAGSYPGPDREPAQPKPAATYPEPPAPPTEPVQPEGKHPRPMKVGYDDVCTGVNCKCPCPHEPAKATTAGVNCPCVQLQGSCQCIYGAPAKATPQAVAPALGYIPIIRPHGDGGVVEPTAPSNNGIMPGPGPQVPGGRPMVYTVPLTAPQQVYYQPTAAGCVGGNCPTSYGTGIYTTAPVRRGLFGGLFGRR